MQHDTYCIQNVECGENLALGYASHPGYPVTTFFRDGNFALIEGAIYGPDPATTQRELLSILDIFQQDSETGRSAAERWAKANDGDFILVFVLPATSRLLIVNDTLGRLPLYLSVTRNTLAIARELKFIRTWTVNPTVDRQAIAQMLLFGWPLGTRTLIEQASRLAPGSSLYVSLAEESFELRQYHVWDFESLGRETPRSSTPQELASLLVDRCRAQAIWAESRPLIVSLSGGLDSRTVATGLVNAGANIAAITCLDDANEFAADAVVAPRIAEQLGIPWSLYKLKPPTWEEAERLTRLRDGMGSIGVSFMLEYLTRIRDDVGPNVCYFTGDGGDKSLGEVRHPPPTKGLDRFVATLLRAGFWPASSVAEFLGLPYADISECIRMHVSTYPERTAQARAARFAHSEHAWHWLFEGEDRNRSFVWTMTPFYCQSFLARALALCTAQKKHDAFYGRVIEALSREVARIPNANWGAPIGSTQARLRVVLRDLALMLPRPVRSAIRRRVLPFYATTNILPRYRERVKVLLRDPAVSAVFSEPAVERALDRGFSRIQSQMLIAPLLYLDLAF